MDLAGVNRATSLSDYLVRLAGARLATDPGTSFAYANPNYDVLARLVEVAAGQPFGDVLDDQVFGPLGMTTSAVDDRRIRPALGHQSWFGVFVPRPESEMFSRSSGSAGLITTADDLARWSRYQVTNSPALVSPGSFRLIHTPPDPARSTYAMGWLADPGRAAFRHDGLMFTYRAQQLVLPDSGWAVAVMLNSSSAADPTLEMTDSLVDLVSGRDAVPTGGSRALVEGLLLAATLLALVPGVLGTLRARRWRTAADPGPAVQAGPPSRAWPGWCCRP